MTMLEYIYEQPELFLQALKERKALTEEFCRIFAREQPDHIYLVASGTSGNAARAAVPFLEWVWDRPVHAIAPSCLSRVWGERPMLCFISQGGKSTNMLAAAEQKKGSLRIAITGNQKASLNALCEHQLLIPCGEEAVGPKTKGYTMTILLLYVMALESGRVAGCFAQERYEACIRTLERAASQLSENIQRARGWVDENEEDLKLLSEVYLAGRGQSADIAREGALKVMETLMISASAFEFEEYLHGPSCALGKRIGGVYFLPLDQEDKGQGKREYSRIKEMAAYHREISPLVFCIDKEIRCTKLPSGMDRDKRDLYLLSSGEWFTKPFEEILPFQMISAIIPGKKGIEGLGMKCFKAIDQRLGVKEKEKSDGNCTGN